MNDQEWDLNTGQTVRTYPTHKAQLSSVSLRPVGFPSSPTPSPRPKAPGEEEEEEEEGNEDPAMNISISMGPDFFGKKEMENLKQEGENGKESSGDKEAEILSEQKPSNDIEMADAASAVSGTGDSLFGDDDAEGETAPASILPTTIPSPSLPSPPKPKPLGLALPGQRQSSSAPISTKETETAPVSAPLFAPQASASSARQGAADVIPVLSPVNWKAYSEDVLLTSSMDGQLVLIDRRVPSYEGTGAGVGRLLPGEKTPPWCMSVSPRLHYLRLTINIWLGMLVVERKSGPRRKEKWDCGNMGCAERFQFYWAQLASLSQNTCGIGPYKLRSGIPRRSAYCNVRWFLPYYPT